LSVFGRRAAAKTTSFRIENKREAFPRIGKNQVAKKKKRKGERGEWWRTHRNQNDNKTARQGAVRNAWPRKKKNIRNMQFRERGRTGRKQKRKGTGYDESPR
jgi:lipopolysaccharide biosynthesis protein